jgi:hypothetical protein
MEKLDGIGQLDNSMLALYKINEIVDWINTHEMNHDEDQCIKNEDIDKQLEDKKKEPVDVGIYRFCEECGKKFCTCPERNPDGSWQPAVEIEQKRKDRDDKLADILVDFHNGIHSPTSRENAIKQIKSVCGIKE